MDSRNAQPAQDAGEWVSQASLPRTGHEQVGLLSLSAGDHSQIEAMLRRAVIIQENGPTDDVALGSCVTVVEEGAEEAEVFRIVGPAEADPANGKVSNESPLGRALLEHRIGDIITVEAPGREIVFRITAIR